MPKSGIEIPFRGVGERAAAQHFARRWAKKKSRMTEADIAWLFLCARWPAFVHGQKGSPAAEMLGDGLTPQGRASRLAKLFAEYPDIAPAVWIGARSAAKREHRPDAERTRLSKAREAVRLFALEHRLSWMRRDTDELRKWAARFTTPENRAEIERDIENLCAVKPMPLPTQSEIAAYLSSRYGGDWEATVEDAIQAERGHVSGKKRRRNPGQGV